MKGEIVINFDTLGTQLINHIGFNSEIEHNLENVN